MASGRSWRRYRLLSSPKGALTAATVIITTMPTKHITMSERHHFSPLALLRLQTWLSPAFPIGAYSYSHGLDWAVEANYIKDRQSLIDWLEADLRHGSGRNEVIFFSQAWRCAMQGDRATLVGIAELAAAFRGTSEFALESSQQAAACRTTLLQVWPNHLLRWLSETLSDCNVPPALAVV